MKRLVPLALILLLAGAGQSRDGARHPQFWRSIPEKQFQVELWPASDRQSRSLQ